MASVNGGTAVESGYYWNITEWKVVPVANDGDRLPGKPTEHYRPVPLLLALVLIPLMGGLFLMFLPVAGFVLTFHAIALKAARVFQRSAGELASTVGPGWKAGEAHLTGTHPDGEAPEQRPAAGGEALEKLEREIDRKRGEEKN